MLHSTDEPWGGVGYDGASHDQVIPVYLLVLFLNRYLNFK